MLKVWEWRARPWSPSIKTLRAVGAVRPTTLIFIKILIKLSGTLTDTVLTTHTAHRRNLEQTLHKLNVHVDVNCLKEWRSFFYDKSFA